MANIVYRSNAAALDVDTYRKLDYSQDYNQITQNFEMYKASVMQKQKEEEPYPKDIWLNQDKQEILRHVLNELDDDSENEYGRQVYKKERDPEYKYLVEQRQKLQKEFLNKRQQIMEENKEKRRQGVREIRVPKVNEFEDSEDILLIDSKLQAREQVFRNKLEDQRRQIFRLSEPDNGEFDGERPNMINQLNIATHNHSLSFDKRVEMAILALRERRRYNQLRKLGIKVPLTYARVHSIKVLPKAVQDEILAYPSAITDDSDYEDDETVKKNYKDDPIKYIQQFSQQKREKLEAGEEPRRLYQAREKAGHFRFKDLVQEVYQQAVHQALTDHGVRRGVTKEKLDGTYKRPAYFNEKFLQELQTEYLIEFIKKFYDQYGEKIFEQFPDARERFLTMLKGNRIKLRKYPEVVRAMFKKEQDMIPEDLRPEENLQQSVLIKQMEDHISRRQSQVTEKRMGDQFDSEQDQEGIEPSALMNEEEIKEFRQSLRNSKAQNKEPDESSKYSWVKQDSKDQNRQMFLNKILDEFSSGSSGNTQDKFNFKDDKINEHQVIEEQLREEKNKRESQYWHQFYDYIVKRTNDLGLETLKQYIPTDEQRKLTRREQTGYYAWQNLGSSAEESDDSLKVGNFSHPLLQAKQKVHNQKRIPIKKTFKERKPTDKVNVNGTNYQWGDFVNKTYDEIQYKANHGDIVSHQEFILNQGDSKKEKLLLWNYKTGFQSENSEDERTNYKRVERQYLRQRVQKYGDKPYLRKRPILPFERMLLKFGGSEIIKKVTGKRFETKNISTIYEWIDPTKPVFFDYGDFLLQKTAENAYKIYEKEQQMQFEVMNENHSKQNIFANEMIQLYLLCSKASKDKELLFPIELQSSLPKSKREYLEEINFQGFQSPQVSPKLKEIADEDIRMDKLSINEQSQEPQFDYGQDEYDQHNLEIEQRTPDQKEASYQLDEKYDLAQSQEKQRESKKLSVIKEKTPQRQYKETVIEVEKPTFIIPKEKGPDYASLQKRLFEYQETVFVDDYIEIKNMIQELQAIDPVQIEEKFIPQLEKLVKESNGRLKGFFIWPHHRVGGHEQIYPQGRRYPKRLKQYKHCQENKAIIFGGTEIGYLIANVPYLNPDTWKGAGLPMTNQNGVYFRTPSKERAKEEQKKQARPQAQNRKVREEVKKNDKKRKAGEALKMGAGMGDFHKEDAMFKIEEYLPFMKYSNEENQRTFELLEIQKNFNKGTQFKITLSLLPQQTLQQKDPSSKAVQIINVNKRKGFIQIVYRQARQTDQKKQSSFIDDSLKIGSATIWNLRNIGNQAIEISFIINK